MVGPLSMKLETSIDLHVSINTPFEASLQSPNIKQISSSNCFTFSLCFAFQPLMDTKISLMLYLLTILISISGVLSTTFSFVNQCDYTVWPGILTNAGVPPLPTTGFVLASGESKAITAPASWGGRFWARTHCSEDSNGKFSCLTADCGSDKVECSGNGAKPPATLAEFTLDGAGGMDFFDVSLVDGYNIPMLVVPQGGTGEKCLSTGCVVDLNGACPTELKVTSVDGGASLACKSACEAFNQPQYCCSGAYATPDTCKPSPYSQAFKSACPRAYSYAYDDLTSTFTCADADYIITFCPSPNTSQKSTDNHNTEGHGTTTPSINGGNGTMVYQGAEFDLSGASRTTLRRILRVVAATVAILQIWQLF